MRPLGRRARRLPVLRPKQSRRCPPQSRDPSGEAGRDAPRPTWRAAHPGTCVRRRGSARARSRSRASSLHADAQRPLSALNPEIFPRLIQHPQHLPKLFTSPPSCQEPRDLPANHARLPAAWRPRTRPGRRGGPPPRGAARARAPRATGLDVRGCKSEASYLCELHHDGG